MEYKILLVEDDLGISQAIKTCIKAWGMDAYSVTDFQQVMREFSNYQPHLVLMDISLPFMNGHYWCQQIRQVSTVPIIFISSTSDNMNIIMAINMGADDFIAKPFDQNVLIAKIQAMLRRSYGMQEKQPILEYAGAILDTSNNSLIYNQEQIELSKNEYRILYILMKEAGSVVSREKLMEALWQTDCFVDENTLSVNVNRLRKKLEKRGLSNFISTKHGIGYVLEKK
ncbi:MAG: response regulator transcription factor [Bacillota bacterium]|nr:response regulator transcription factor [Bacillota bacterium]